MVWKNRFWGCLLLCTCVPGWHVVAQPDWQTVTDDRLLNPEPGDWMNYRRTYDATAYSPLDSINRRNVDELRMTWSYAMRDGSRWLATPIVANGLMFIGEGTGRIIALNAVTGELVWSHTRTYPADIALSEANRRFRGVSLYGDTLYWGTADSYVVALDAQTGEKRWETRTADYHDGEGHAHPPLLANGKLFIGMSGGDFAARGSLKALDAQTGEILWTFYTIPGPNDPGAETWDWEAEYPPSGAATWNTLSYDPDLNLVYAPTGQPAPWTTTPEGHGDALYANSVIAVDADTGELRWHYQLVPQDNWDRATYESLLVDLEIDGVERKALIQTGKIGWSVVLDRATGEFLKAYRTAYDNTITDWTAEGRPIYNPDTVPQPEDVDSGKVFQVCPHPHGVRNLNAPSFSPDTGLYYLGVNNSCMNAMVVTPVRHSRFGLTGITYTPTLAPGYDYVGEFVAFDPVAGERRWTWRPESGAPMTASALATAGNIVFGGTADRQFFALDNRNGDLLWQTRLNGDVSGAPISYEIDGRQYIAVTAGGGAAQTSTLGRLVDVDITQGSGVIWVFALPAREPSQVPRPVRADITETSVGSGVFNAAQAARGARVFADHCSDCHEAGNYAGQALHTKWGSFTLGDIYSDIAVSMPPENPGGLPPEDYASIIAYLLSETGYAQGSEDDLLPGDRFQLQRYVIDVPGVNY
ncbi:MAG: PQQ-binding-like beta-propeller repeat protein [Pseudohongiellaceae bacterium]|jgi:PQQ-dependent dehydrogenase (methanol/ethanol family)